MIPKALSRLSVLAVLLLAGLFGGKNFVLGEDRQVGRVVIEATQTDLGWTYLSSLGNCEILVESKRDQYFDRVSVRLGRVVGGDDCSDKDYSLKLALLTPTIARLIEDWSPQDLVVSWGGLRTRTVRIRLIKEALNSEQWADIADHGQRIAILKNEPLVGQMLRDVDAFQELREVFQRHNYCLMVREASLTVAQRFIDLKGDFPALDLPPNAVVPSMATIVFTAREGNCGP